MPTKTVLPKLPKPIGMLTDIGHSHMSDAGATKPYFGAVHKIDGLLQPATFRSTAQGGAIHSRADQGNLTGGDGGWGRQLGEFARLENSYGDSGVLLGATTMTGGPYAVGATSFTVNSISLFYANQYIVVGAGANTEIVRVYGNPAGSTITIQAPGFTKTHAANDPVYHSMTNFGAGGAGLGYNAKDEIVLIGAGANDLGPLGPFAQGVFGTDAGASRGLTPFQNALRFTIAQMRCAVIYLPNHPSNILAGGYTQVAENPSQSYPNQGWFSPMPGQNGNLGYTQTAGSTITVSTAPDFPGGTVCFFFKSNQDGGGALYNLTIDGSSIVPFAGTGILDTRNKQFVQANSSLAQSTGGGLNSSDTGIVYRITGLSAGVHTFVWTAATLGTATYNGMYLGWGVEAPTPPMIFCFLDPRLPSYTAFSNSAYGTRSPVNTQSLSTQTATVGAGAGTAANAVTLGTAVTIGTTATGVGAVYPGDTISIGTGATQETRRVAGVDTTTTLHVDANFVNAHTGEFCIIGYQDADLAGGGYRNKADTQGRTSVPGIWSIIRGVAAEFDRFVQVFSVDTVFTGGLGSDGPTVNSPYFAPDYSHYSDYGQGLLAAQFYHALLKSAWADTEIAMPTVSSQRTYNPVGGDIYPAGQPSSTGGWPTFVNGWTNFWPINTVYPRTGFYMDMRTRQVYVRGAITNQLVYPDQLPSAVFQLPAGYRPAWQTPIKAWGPLGPVAMEIDSLGTVYVTAGYWNLTNGIGGSTGFILFEDVFLSES